MSVCLRESSMVTIIFENPYFHSQTLDQVYSLYDIKFQDIWMSNNEVKWAEYI